MKTKKFIVLCIAFIAFAGFYSCSVEDDNLNNQSEEQVSFKTTDLITPDPNCNTDVLTYSLIAGKNTEAGVITITNDGEFLFVVYVGKDGWMIKETHLYVGSADAIPTNRAGVPVPGQFPYSNSFDEAVESYTYVIPVEELDDCITFLAHAVVVNGDCDKVEEKSCDKSTKSLKSAECGSAGGGRDITPKGHHSNYTHKHHAGKDCDRDRDRDRDNNNCSETAWANGGLNFFDYFHIKRWGYIGEYCLQECKDVKILTVKAFLIDTTTATKYWSVLSTGSSQFDADWCSLMSVVDFEEGATYNLIDKNSAIVGQITTSVVDNNAVIKVISTTENSIIAETMVYLGSQEGFNLLIDGCPMYYKFPYKLKADLVEHVHTISLN